MSKFTSQTAREAGRKSKRGPSKRLEPNIEEKMKLLYEDVLDDLLLNSKDLSPSEKIKFSYKGLNQSGVYAMETKTIFTEKVREYDLTILSKNVFRLNTKILESSTGFDSFERIFFRK